MSKTLQQIYDEQLALNKRHNAQNELYWLLEKAAGVSRSVFFKTEVGDLHDRYATLLSYLDQYQQGVPLAYILGDTPFMGIDIQTEKGVLIPRADTEPMVEALCAMITADMKVCDLGCGTGAIALSIANTCGVGVVAVDKSDQSIRLTEKNADRLGLTHLIQTYLGSWYDKPEIGQFNVVVSNPPYIAKGDSEVWDSVDQHEPHSALYAEDSGLLDIKAIIDYAKSILLPSGIIAIEHGKDQQDEVINLLEDQGFQLLYARKVANLPRYVIARH